MYFPRGRRSVRVGFLVNGRRIRCHIFHAFSGGRGWSGHLSLDCVVCQKRGCPFWSWCPVNASVSMVVPSLVMMSDKRWTCRYSLQLLKSCSSIGFDVVLVAISMSPWSRVRLISIVDRAGMLIVALIAFRNMRAVSSHGALM